MSTLHGFRKGITVNPNLRFDTDMYNNVVGSLIITAWMLSDQSIDPKVINRQWKTLKKKGLDFWLDDPEFVNKVLAKFNLEVPYGRFAMIQSELNILFLPYVDETVLPIREDGIYPLSARNGKVYPVVKEDVVDAQ